MHACYLSRVLYTPDSQRFTEERVGLCRVLLDLLVPALPPGVGQVLTIGRRTGSGSRGWAGQETGAWTGRPAGFRAWAIMPLLPPTYVINV